MAAMRPPPGARAVPVAEAERRLWARSDSLLEGTGFELLVPRGDGLRWVSLQFAVASRLSQQDCHAASSKISGE